MRREDEDEGLCELADRGTEGGVRGGGEERGKAREEGGDGEMSWICVASLSESRRERGLEVDQRTGLFFRVKVFGLPLGTNRWEISNTHSLLPERVFKSLIVSS